VGVKNPTFCLYIEDGKIHTVYTICKFLVAEFNEHESALLDLFSESFAGLNVQTSRSHASDLARVRGFNIALCVVGPNEEVGIYNVASPPLPNC
jgi:hypothetical protein